MPTRSDHQAAFGWPNERNALLAGALALSGAMLALAWIDARQAGGTPSQHPASLRAAPAAPSGKPEPVTGQQALPDSLAHRTATRRGGAATASGHDLEAQMQRFALNALLVPVLDEADHPYRWADPALALPCGPATRVDVDRQPLQPRTEQTGRSFTLRWQLDHCVPFGVEGPVLTGKAELDVFRDDDGLSAIVRFEQLHVERQGEEVVLTRQFAARMP